MATLDQVIQQMMSADMPPLPPGHPILDGRPHRFGREKKAWYILHEHSSRTGKQVIVGAFGRWQGTDNGAIRVSAEGDGIDADELQRLRETLATNEKREAEKKEKRARFTAGRAIDQWNAARARLAEGESNPYLAKKRLQWEKGLRVFKDGTLLVPMVRYDVTEEQDADPAYTGPRRLAGLQKIAPDGSKLFNKGMAKLGVAARFGKAKDGDLLLVGEGLATVLSVHQALERVHPSFVAFDAGNLEPVAKILRAQYPSSPIVILADDDAYIEAQLNKRLRTDYGVHELYKVLDGERELKSDKYGTVRVHAHVYEDEKGTPLLTVGITVDERTRTFTITNAGRTKAWAAAAAIGNAYVIWPRFSTRVLGNDPDAARLTDFNDLHCAEGLDRVVEQVGGAIREVNAALELARAIAKGAPTPREGASGGKDGGGEDEPDWHLHGSLLGRFTLIERSDMAWDSERGYLWRISHMRLTFGSRPVAMWLASKRRRSVDLSQVVFDPTGKADPKTTVNLFGGLEMKPKAGSCEKLLALLHYLCGENPEDAEAPITTWVLKWCAYQVQHVGVKMKTAVVMFGPEGTGKNLFWGAFKKIFGRYGALITQAELEDKHNTWLSAKLFLIANEVVTRAEMSHHVGRLKNLVTEDEVYINPKMVDQRYESNHVNLVFLSNEFQPLKISPGDRRYMVIRTPPALPGEFYGEVSAEERAGGGEAFMQYLLDLDVGDFNPHTKPIVTEAKLDLIEIGMFPSQIFWKEIKDELLPLPYCPALTEDVYRAYTIWCLRRGHKMPEALNRFSPAFMSMNGVRRVEPRVPDPEKLNELALASDKLRKRRVFLMGERRRDVDERTWIVDGLVTFRKALRAYEAEGGRHWKSADEEGARDREPAW